MCPWKPVAFVRPLSLALLAAYLFASPTYAITWNHIADEFEVFTLDKAKPVRFGAGGNWVQATLIGAHACVSSTFGSDPAPGVVKSCEAQQDAAPPPVALWSKVADESQPFTVVGNRIVRFGIEPNWVGKTVTGEVLCARSTFGRDPAPGIRKICEIKNDGGAPPAVVNPPETTTTPCVPSGSGTDYQIGPDPDQLQSLDAVPWESLAAGDTVRIFYRPTAYPGKFLIAAKGTASRPVRVCGVRGPNGERPIITGQNAKTRLGLPYGNSFHEARGIIIVMSMTTQDYTYYPEHIQIDGLKLQQAHPAYKFADANGVAKSYLPFGACIWVERGHHVTIADNEITDCSQAIFSRSYDDGPFRRTQHLRIVGNDMHGNGVVGDGGIHTAYIQSIDVVYEFNRFGPLRAGATGNSLKDRSVGAVIRYNRVEDGARALDLVEAEDFASVAKANPTYRSTYVYGNQIIKDGRKGSTIHYGGDHPGSESNYRKGTLYFFNNTVRITGKDYAVLFQLSTTEERAEVWNNVFYFDPGTPYPAMRSKQDVDVGYISGGILNLGRNWISEGWADSDPYHPNPNELLGVENMITGASAPIDITTLQPLPGSAIVDAAQATGPVAASAHAVKFQLGPGLKRIPRTVRGNAMDLGAIER
jgi:hypothetical protein